MNGVSCKLAAAGVVAPGTAIGMGVANSVSHLQQSKSKSKVIILLTDGIDNTGEISPQMAAELAKENGIRVYTISVGGSEPAFEQATDESIDGVGGVQKAPDVLKNIADITGGKYYHANSRQKLKEIYGDIDKLEKSKLKKKNFEKLHDVYQLFALIAILLLVVEILIKYVWLRRIP
jgi:Ca-activated chloride channel family protein